VVIDDIDRLTPEETRQLFTVIKALADFPNVIYLLAFDREVAAQAISEQTGMPGERYLEKIIQVPFELPPVDRIALRAALFRGLDEIIKDTPEGLFDSAYWVNVYHDGLDKLFTVPRDVVRFLNTLAVTYLAVRGEVNPVDYIALEAIRVFAPSLYHIIRTNPEQFAGHRPVSSSSTNAAEKEAMRKEWLADVPPSFRSQAMELLERLFPKLEQSSYGADWLKSWRLALRVCHPDIFPTYFRFYVSEDAIRRSDIHAIIESAESPQALSERFISAAQYRMPDGRSKVRALLDRLLDHIETIPIHYVPTFIRVLLSDGDRLLVETDVQTMFDSSNDLYVFRLVYNLVKRLEPGDRLPILTAAFTTGNGIYSQCFFLRWLLDDVAKGKTNDLLLPVADLEMLKSTWVTKICSMRKELLDHPQLRSLLYHWRMWGASEEVQSWCQEATQSDGELFQFLERFATHISANKLGDSAVTKRLRLNPKWLEGFIDPTTISDRLSRLNEKGLVPSAAKVVVTQFFNELRILQEGKDPDSPFAFKNS